MRSHCVTAAGTVIIYFIRLVIIGRVLQPENVKKKKYYVMVNILRCKRKTRFDLCPYTPNGFLLESYFFQTVQVYRTIRYDVPIYITEIKRHDKVFMFNGTRVKRKKKISK